MKIPQILIADDDADIQRLFAKILESVGYDVITVTDGQAVIRVLETERPNLLLLDLVMPSLSGVDTLTRIRSDARFNTLRIIALSGDPRAMNMPEVQQADCILMKPLSMDKLIDVVNQYVEAPT